MAFYTWNENYSVGIPEMDEQHKKLIGMINQLHDAMKEGRVKAELGKIIEEMVEYTKYHFTAEEKLMAEYKYPGLAAQKADHTAFILKVQDFITDLNSGKLAMGIDVLSFLKDWLTNHIMITDKKYSGMMMK
jgi:hemerythrin